MIERFDLNFLSSHLQVYYEIIIIFKNRMHFSQIQMAGSMYGVHVHVCLCHIFEHICL